MLDCPASSSSTRWQVHSRSTASSSTMPRAQRVAEQAQSRVVERAPPISATDITRT
jgi:hypothetical protein